MSKPLEALLRYIEVERVDTYLFTGRSPKRPRRIFGGQVLAQSLNAANRSVGDEWVAASDSRITSAAGRPSGPFRHSSA